MQLAYAVSLRPEEETLIVRCRDLPELLTFGSNEAEALTEAEDALDVVLLTYVEKGLPLPPPSPPAPSERLVAPSAQVAAKLAVIAAFQAAGISKSDLARRMGVAEGEARRILDPDYGSKLPALASALRALGKRLTLVVEDA